ncbi:Bug family tripartite tricarboxylate transporter substrate binding protein, partial [Roseateles sp.]|uniref:Bug family tripartite tricarboxylate transporter substrate binding protein n=1 Tax=Roseateles sp. TaxID=1971397 RepID=UPI002F3F294D
MTTGLAAALGLSSEARAQTSNATAAGESWPTRPLHLIVAYPPGGVSDETARALGQHMSTRLKVPVIVENRAGAGGLTALESLARAAPDGHTLAYCAISPLVFVPVSSAVPTPDVAPVVSIMDTPVLVLAH